MFYFNSSNIKKNHYAFKKDFLNKTYLHLFQSKHLKNNSMKTNIKFNHFPIWNKAASLLMIALFLFSIPENVKADIPCNTIQSVSYAWPCPNGNQGYFSYCSDGCHVYIKYDDCMGIYHEWYYSANRNIKPKTGDKEVDYLFNIVINDFNLLLVKKKTTNKDVMSFLKISINKVSKRINIGIDYAKKPVKGKVSFNTAPQKEIDKFLEFIKGDSKL